MIIKVDDTLTVNTKEVQSDKLSKCVGYIPEADCENFRASFKKPSNLTKEKGISCNKLEQTVKENLIHAEWNIIQKIKQFLCSCIHSLRSHRLPEETGRLQTEVEGIVNDDVKKKNIVRERQIRRRNRKRRRKSNDLKKAEQAVTKTCKKEIAKPTQRRFEISRFLLCLLFLYFAQFTNASSTDNEICLGRQEAKLHTRGIVSCNVSHNRDVYWYKGTDETSGNTAFIQMVDGMVDGEGYASGEFDILDDGSLIIFNVTHGHESHFRVKTVNARHVIHTFNIQLFVYDTEFCPGRQEVCILYTRVVVNCTVVHTLEEVYWFNKTDEISGSTAFIQMVNGIVGGDGYESGEFDISSDGSLIINNVTRHHECHFHVKTVDSRRMINSYNVQLFVSVPRAPPTILVEGCLNYRPCDVIATTSLQYISCRVAVVHPKIQLIMEVLSKNVILTEVVKGSIEEDGMLYTTVKGKVMMRNIICGESETVLCKAVGTTQERFISEVYIRVTNGNETCSSRPVEKDPGGSDPSIVQRGPSKLYILLYFSLVCLVLFVSITIVRKCKLQRNQISSNNHSEALV